MKTLYTAEGFGSECIIGTREDWETGMEKCFREEYKDYANHPATRSLVDYETWVEQTLDENLNKAEDEELGYERLQF